MDTPPPKKAKVAGSTPVTHKCFSPSLYVARRQCWSIYKVRRRIVFNDALPNGVLIGSLITVPGTPDKTYKAPTLPVPTEM